MVSAPFRAAFGRSWKKMNGAKERTHRGARLSHACDCFDRFCACGRPGRRRLRGKVRKRGSECASIPRRNDVDINPDIEPNPLAAAPGALADAE